MEQPLNSVLAELESLLVHAKSLENKYLADILAIEKLVNHTYKCVAVPREMAKKEPQKVESKISVQDKVDALINDIEIKQRNIQSQLKPKPQPKPEPVDKKPPIPTANRNQKLVRNVVPAYVPPKNRNEVTGKVTQTALRTSQKVFRPEKNVAKSEIKSNNNLRSKGSTEKIIAHKQQKKEEVKIVKRQLRQQPKPKVELETASEIKKTIPNVKLVVSQQVTIKERKEVPFQRQRLKLANFHKEVEQVLQELFSKNSKNHKLQLHHMIADLQGEQKGHRMHEQTHRVQFIRKTNHFTISRHHVHRSFTHQLTRKKWPCHPELFNYQVLLHSLQNQLANLQLLKDCKIDPKEQFRIIHSASFLSKNIDLIVQQSRSVPDQIDLTFSHTEIQKATQSNGNDEHQLQGLSLKNLNQTLHSLLGAIGERGTLQKTELRGLQVISEVGVFKSKRSPLLVMRQQYSNWKDYYEKGDDQ